MNDIIYKIKRFFGSMDPLFWVFLAILVVERLMNGTDALGQAIIDTLLMPPGIVLGVPPHAARPPSASH